MRRREITLIILAVLLIPLAASGLSQNGPQPQVLTSYDKSKDKTTVRLAPLKISDGKAQYQSVHIAPSFSYPGQTLKRPEIIDFEVKTVTTKLKVDLYVVFLVDGETIFLSSNRWGVRRPVAGKRWVGERLVFRMPYETLVKIATAKTVEIKMDGVRFPLSEDGLEAIREFATIATVPERH